MIELWIVLGIIGTYITSSLILGRFPTILHKKKKQKFKCQHISHRGGAGEHLENTITAYREAIKNGTDMLELDVQITEDGVVVVSHDNELARCTGIESMISNTNYEDLPCILKTLDVTFDIGKKITSEVTDCSIPTLRQVFEEFPDVPINIDIKRNSDELIDKTIRLVQEFNRQHLVCIGNFNEAIVKKVHRKDPEIPILFSMTGVVKLCLLFYIGLLPFIPLKEDFFEIPLPRIILRHPHSFQNIRWLIRIADWLLISPMLFRHLQRRGIQVYLFVINEEEDFDLCLNRFGVDGIMTDYPTKLTSYIRQSPISREQDELRSILSTE